MTRYRRCLCDNCHRIATDCLWMRRESSGHEYVLCGRCRTMWRGSGHRLTNTDPDFPSVELDNREPVEDGEAFRGVEAKAFDRDQQAEIQRTLK